MSATQRDHSSLVAYARVTPALRWVPYLLFDTVNGEPHISVRPPVNRQENKAFSSPHLPRILITAHPQQGRALLASFNLTHFHEPRNVTYISLPEYLVQRSCSNRNKIAFMRTSYGFEPEGYTQGMAA